MIKAYSVNYENTQKKIDLTEKEQKLTELRKRQFASFLPEEERQESIPETTFTEGIPAPEIELKEEAREEIREELQQQMQMESEAIIHKATMTAEKLVKEAEEQAVQIKEEAFAQAKEQGYQEGIRLARQEQERITNELHQKSIHMEEDYERQVSGLEPAFVEVLISLLQKVTGVSYDTHREVLLYLMHEGVTKCGKSHQYLVHVASDDYENAKLIIGYLEEEIKEQGASVELLEDHLLERGDCLIETDSRVIDCGLGTQMIGLVESIRMLES